MYMHKVAGGFHDYDIAFRVVPGSGRRYNPTGRASRLVVVRLIL